MKNFLLANFTNMIAFFALAVAIFSLAWNIIRDLIKDRTKINFSISVGQLHLMKNGITGLFIPFASETDEIINPELLVNIVNEGRRNIVISKVEFKKKYQKHLYHIAISGLPKKLEPYEVFSQTISFKDTLLEEIKKKNIKKIWAEDTSQKKWYMSKKNLKSLLSQIEDYFNKKYIQNK